MSSRNGIDPEEAARKELRDFGQKIGFELSEGPSQRRFGVPANNPDYPRPKRGCEIFVNHIPRLFNEKQIYDMFHPFGEVYEIRLMLSYASLTNRGFCFVKFMDPSSVDKAIQSLNDPVKYAYLRKPIVVVRSQENHVLWAKYLHPSVTRRNLCDELTKWGVSYFTGVEYKTGSLHAKIVFPDHRQAALARRHLSTIPNPPWDRIEWYIKRPQSLQDERSEKGIRTDNPLPVLPRPRHSYTPQLFGNISSPLLRPRLFDSQQMRHPSPQPVNPLLALMNLAQHHQLSPQVPQTIPGSTLRTFQQPNHLLPVTSRVSAA